MDIAWIGHAAFRLRGRDVAVVTDPCPSSTGFKLGRPQADIVTVSSPDPAFSWTDGVAGDPLILTAPGEYECKAVLVTGIVTPLAGTGGAAPGRNVAYVITIDDVVVTHLGNLRALPPADQLEELQRGSVLILPIGGHGHLDAAAAEQVIATLEPQLVIPMLYKVGPETEDLDALDRFLRQLGAQLPSTLDNHINVTAGSLPEIPTIHVLAPRGD